jgi:hypothetical protein
MVTAGLSPIVNVRRDGPSGGREARVCDSLVPSMSLPLANPEPPSELGSMSHDSLP